MPGRLVLPVALMVLLALVGGGLAVDQLATTAVPDGPRDDLVAAAYGGSDDRADWHLDLAWQRLVTLETLLRSLGGRDSAHVRALISSVVSTYAAALEAIEAQDDARLALRAGTELRVARQLVAGAGTRDAPPVFVARVALAASELDGLIERADALSRRLVVAAGPEPRATPIASPTGGGPTPNPMAGAATAEHLTSMPPTVNAPGQPPASTPHTATPERPAPASETRVFPSATATPMRPAQQPTTVPPTASPTISGSTDPGGTPVKPTPTNTPDAVKGAVTVTPDSWPVTSTPRPRATDAPIVPTENPGAIPSAALPTEPVPTPGSTQLAPPAPGPTRSGQPDRP